MVDNAVQITLSLLQDLFGSFYPCHFAVRLWDGTIWKSEPAEPTLCTLVLNHPGALRSMFLSPSDLKLGEEYIYNHVDIEGDIGAVFPIAYQLLDRHWKRAELLGYSLRLLRLPKVVRVGSTSSGVKLYGKLHSKERDRQAVAYHYDRSNDFYALWLDKRMIYSCAYFTTPDEDLDMAQEHKLDYICRKLRLRPGERLLDIGCGWGGLIIYAAQHFGVEAYGITLSRRQAELARQRIQEAGLGERCCVEVRDYRDLKERHSFAKIVSIGMFEHVGQRVLPTYFKQVWYLLCPGGIFLNHGIARNIDIQTRRGATFGHRYVFPDGELVPISTTLRIAEMSGFEVRDVESLREHYTLTLRHWVRRLEERVDEAVRLTSDVTYRIWRLYMSASAYLFQSGRSNVYQVLLSKPDHGNSGLPLTRADWYTEG